MPDPTFTVPATVLAILLAVAETILTTAKKRRRKTFKGA